MKSVIIFQSAAITAIGAPADDYKAITKGLPSLKMGGTAGGVALSGRMAFLLAISSKREVPAGAGYFGDSEKGGRVACFAQTSFAGDPALAKNIAVAKASVVAACQLTIEVTDSTIPLTTKSAMLGVAVE